MSLLLAPFQPVAAALGGLRSGLRHHGGRFRVGLAATVAAAAVIGLVFTLERPAPRNVQLGYRGTGMGAIYNARLVAQQLGLQQVDAPLPPSIPAGKTAAQAYKNIQVLQNLDANEFLRLMGAMTQWIAPQAGCAFCHSLKNMADDSIYTKTVARRMLQMVMAINTQWQSHVDGVGVTCQTCHRGRAIPAGSWFIQPPPHGERNATEADSGQDLPAAVAGGSAFPYDPLTPFLLSAMPIRVTGTTALPNGDRSSVNQTDWTYSLMIHFADSLGVNCTFCHNTRAFEEWDQGTPNRVSAWHAIPMVRDLNRNYMAPLAQVFPVELRGKLDDAPKVSCVTCHNGAYKPFYGASGLPYYPELAHAVTMTPPAGSRP